MTERMPANTGDAPHYSAGTMLEYIAEEPTFDNAVSPVYTNGLTDQKTYEVNTTGEGNEQKVDMEPDLDVDTLPDSEPEK